ncbi:MAG: thioredoxin, partial [Bacteroidota bacterium]
MMKRILLLLALAGLLTACSSTQKTSNKSNAATVEYNDATLKKALKKNNQVIVLEFWAEWCGPCKMLDPIVQELAEEYKGKAIVGKINVDENPIAKINYEIKSIPIILFFKNGELVDQQKGLSSKAAIS